MRFSPQSAKEQLPQFALELLVVLFWRLLGGVVVPLVEIAVVNLEHIHGSIFSAVSCTEAFEEVMTISVELSCHRLWCVAPSVDLTVDMDLLQVGTLSKPCQCGDVLGIMSVTVCFFHLLPIDTQRVALLPTEMLEGTRLTMALLTPLP